VQHLLYPLMFFLLSTIASTLGVDGRRCYDKDWRTAAGFIMSPPINPDPKVKEDMMRRVGAKQIDVISTVGCKR
jgi:dihydropyrimidinase